MYVPSMYINLIPLFIVREAGVVINDKPKIHVSDPSLDDHAIIFVKDNMRIPLKLNGIFSYFEMTTLSPEQVRDCEDVFLITPEHNWDPHTKVYASNEENIVDWEGNIKEKQDRVRIMLEDIDETQPQSSACISALESSYIDSNMQDREPLVRHQSQSYKEVSPIYDHNRLFTSLLEKDDEIQFKISIESTITHDSDYLWGDDEYKYDNS